MPSCYLNDSLWWWIHIWFCRCLSAFFLYFVLEGVKSKKRNWPASSPIWKHSRRWRRTAWGIILICSLDCAQWASRGGTIWPEIRACRELLTAGTFAAVPCKCSAGEDAACAYFCSVCLELKERRFWTLCWWNIQVQNSNVIFWRSVFSLEGQANEGGRAVGAC